jgi:hypothetical protein
VAKRSGKWLDIDGPRFDSGRPAAAPTSSMFWSRPAFKKVEESSVSCEIGGWVVLWPSGPGNGLRSTVPGLILGAVSARTLPLFSGRLREDVWEDFCSPGKTFRSPGKFLGRLFALLGNFWGDFSLSWETFEETFPSPGKLLGRLFALLGNFWGDFSLSWETFGETFAASLVRLAGPFVPPPCVWRPRSFLPRAFGVPVCCFPRAFGGPFAASPVRLACPLAASPARLVSPFVPPPCVW